MQRPTKDYYELLGVERDASTEQIKEAYREIARVYHPDSNFYDEILEDDLKGTELRIFKEITAAYQTLIDNGRRSQYNQSLPPTLPDWEGEECHDRLQSRTDWDAPISSHPATATARKRKPTGNFGRSATPVFEELKSSFDDIEFGKNITPVSAMFRKKQSVLSRLLGLLGLS